MARTIVGSASGVIQIRESTKTAPLKQINFSPITGDTDADIGGTRVLTNTTKVTLWDASTDDPDSFAHMIYIKAISTVNKAARSITLDISKTGPTVFAFPITEIILFIKENSNIIKIEVTAQSGDDTEVEWFVLGV